MKLIWIGYIIEILILSLIKPYVTNFEGVAIIAVLVHVIFSMVILYLCNRKIRYVINSIVFEVYTCVISLLCLNELEHKKSISKFKILKQSMYISKHY